MTVLLWNFEPKLLKYSNPTLHAYNLGSLSPPHICKSKHQTTYYGTPKDCYSIAVPRKGSKREITAGICHIWETRWREGGDHGKSEYKTSIRQQMREAKTSENLRFHFHCRCNSLVNTSPSRKNKTKKRRKHTS